VFTDDEWQQFPDEVKAVVNKMGQMKDMPEVQ
jgi:hypothetical protein